MLASARGMEVVDLVTAFQAVPHAERLYYPVDSHPGPGADRLIGHALATYLTEYFRFHSNAAVAGLYKRFND
jgi:hypothetical protein